MGDLLLSLPAVCAIRQKFPDAEMDLLIRKEWVPLLEGHPDVNRLLPWDAGCGTGSGWPAGQAGWRAIGRTALWLRRRGPDAILILHPSRLFHVASFLAGIPVRIGYRRKWGRLLTHSIPDTKSERNLHETEYNVELLGLLGISRPPEIRCVLPERPESQRQARELLAACGIPPDVHPIALHPWTSHPAKSLPAGFFGAVAGALAEGGQTVLCIGEPAHSVRGEPFDSAAHAEPFGFAQDRLVEAERPAQDRPAEPRTESPFDRSALSFVEGLRANGKSGSQAGGIVNLVGKTPLGLLPELLRMCRVLVSNDSGPVHVAAAVGTPTVVVAPRSHASQLHRWRPLGKRHTLILDPTPAQVLEAVRDAGGAG